MNKKPKLTYPQPKAGATIAVREAKAKFSALLDRAAGGEEIVITWHGRPRARLIPVEEPRGSLRVDRKWLENMKIGSSTKSADAFVREDRDNRG